MNAQTTALVDAIRASSNRQILWVTGAGVSLASGIPTFRGNDPGAVWSNNVKQMGTHRFFRENPAESWRWYLSRFGGLEDKQPNAAHHAIAAIEKWQLARGGDSLLVTQNVDLLHERAGTQRLVKVHGTSDRYRCDADEGECELGAPRGSIASREVDLAPFLANPTRETVPACPLCKGPLRMHVLWFDEYYTQHKDYQFDRVVWAVRKESAVVVFAGTSFAVGITGIILEHAKDRRLPIFNVDPTPRIETSGVTHIQAPAESALMEVCRALGVPLPASES